MFFYFSKTKTKRMMNENALWSIQKGVYCPPTTLVYPKLKRREIEISDSIHEKIGLIIGKDGEHFISLTKKYNLLYVFYHDKKIELYGINDYNIKGAIYELIKKIKYMNFLERQNENTET
jgi:hypothetical protein